MQLPFHINLKDQVCVITGAGGVICKSFAKAVAACGAKVALLDINLAAAQAAADEIIKDGGTALAVEANVLNTESLTAAYEKVKAAFGPCDILINGAGGNNPKGTTTKEYLEAQDLAAVQKDVTTFYDLDPEGISFVFDLNFLGTLLPTQIFTRDMAQKQKGNIINISSMNAFSPLTKIPAYSAAKAAISNFTQWLCVHFSKVNIRVNAIAPGFFVTGQNKSLLYDENGNLTPRSQKILSQTPMSRFGEIDELTGALLFLLCEDASSFVNGIVLPIDGGFSAYSGV
jgi:NAD(P)-dependent dehydrogenase (short-subunit alcohol dehydrogenase family)